jgi:hypothetical protein
MRDRLLFYIARHVRRQAGLWRKAGLTVILVGLLLAAAGCSGGGKSGTTDTAESIAVKETISSYFAAYFKSQESLCYSKMSSDILTDNDNTQLNEAFRETLLARKRLYNKGITNNYQYRTNYQKVVINGKEATVTLTLDLDFQYQNAPSGVESGVYGINYSIALKNNGARWVITEIESDLADYQFFKAQVQAEKDQDPELSKKEVIEKVGDSIMKRMQQNSIYLKGEPGATTEAENPATTSTSDGASNTAITKSVYVSCNKYNYSATAAVDYALTFANPVDDSNKVDLIFYKINADCTNFVSQCIWAGYVGFSAAAVAAAKTKIAKRTGMIYTEWHAGTGGGTDSWENVDDMFGYMSDTAKDAGPKVTVYNNNKRYTGVEISSINPGDVLQFKNSFGGGSGYDHSVIVTAKASNADSYSEVFITCHTTNHRNYSLQEIIDGFGSWYYCYMRRLVPQSGCYMK